MPSYRAEHDAVPLTEEGLHEAAGEVRVATKAHC